MTIYRENSGQSAVNVWPIFIPGGGALAMTIYREDPFSGFESTQPKERHPGESRGPEHVQIPLWRNWIAAFAAMTERFSSTGVAPLAMTIYPENVGSEGGVSCAHQGLEVVNGCLSN
jgi:hypothetical protein